MNRHIVVALLLLSPFFVVLQGQTVAMAVLVSSTTTQTVTSYITLTGTGQTTQYTTFTQLSSVQTVTGTTYTTTGVAMVPVQVLATAVQPVVVRTATGGTSCDASGEHCIGWAKIATVTYYVTQTGYMLSYSPSTIQGAVTNQYVTNVPTTLFSTSASTSTYSTGQVVAITATQTLTSVSEQAGPSISDMLSENLWIVLVLFAVVIGVLGFRLGRRGGRAPSGISPPGVFCSSCGARMAQEAQFCPKCGQKRASI